ncbi:Multidrug resistance protein MdtA precursor [Poriferisphaera corsica]|uniref:Multidrug resistance protein MdtA n=1 Tax=Poriferisphaera corsica TaxID=2528020 RepID=A0A517YS05_9BACT|nr:efflux RND transporter periplasmic adaptor subunit [Poriferisphaera corsica]QDU32998.1 Multidrug resistance protein MdtA precursor [Poriferisphaera corsica]
MGHSTNKVFWISILAAGGGLVLGALFTSTVFTYVIRAQAMKEIEKVKEQIRAGASQGAPPASVRVDYAAYESVQNRFDVVGRLQELQMSEIASEVEGKVLRVPVEEGDRVVGGETVVAEIDGTWAELALKQAQADVAARKATLVKSEGDLKLLEQLARANSAKPKEVTDMRAQVESERANLEAAVAVVEKAREQIDRLKITAPFDGVVVNQMTEEGQWVSPGGSIAEIISDGQIDAIVNVPERFINMISIDDKVAVVIDAIGQKFEGDVVSITPMGSNSSRTFPVKVRLNDVNGRLLPGMSVTARLPIGTQSDEVIVPRDALLFTAKGPVVWVAVPPEDGQGMPIAMSVPVRELFGQNGKVVVEPTNPATADLLADGTQVVVMGAEQILFPGQSLAIDNAPIAEQPKDNGSSLPEPATSEPAKTEAKIDS